MDGHRKNGKCRIGRRGKRDGWPNEKLSEKRNKGIKTKRRVELGGWAQEKMEC